MRFQTNSYRKVGWKAVVALAPSGSGWWRWVVSMTRPQGRLVGAP